MEAHKAFKGVYLWVVGTWNPLILPFLQLLSTNYQRASRKWWLEMRTCSKKLLLLTLIILYGGGLYVDVLLFQVFPH